MKNGTTMGKERCDGWRIEKTVSLFFLIFYLTQFFIIIIDK